MMSKSNARAQAKHPRQDVKMKRVATEDKNLSKLRVVTYNVNWGFCLAGLGTGMVIRIHNAIMESNADLVCLQETHEGWQTYLERNFKGVYPYMIFKHHLNPDINHQYKEGSSAGGSAFLSKYPIKETFCGIPDVPGSFFPGTMIGLRSPVGVIYVLNVHLRPQISNAHKPSLMAVWSTGTVRKSEIKYLLTKMSSHKPSIIVGDFNEGHGGDAVRWLKYSKKNCNGKGYKDGLSEYAETAVTWKWPLKMGLYLKGAYDHVFYNPTRIRCVGCHVMSAYELVSDHMPVVADMVLLPHTVSTTFPTPSSQTVFNEPVPSTVDNPSPKVGTHVSKSTLGPRHTSPAIVMKDSGSFVKLDLDGNGNAILETNVSLDTAFNSRAGLSLPATSRTALQSSGVDAGTTAAENRSSKCGPGGTDRLTVAKAEFGKDPSYGMDVFEEDFYDEEAERQRQSEQRIQYRKLQRSVSDSVTYLANEMRRACLAEVSHDEDFVMYNFPGEAPWVTESPKTDGWRNDSSGRSPDTMPRYENTEHSDATNTTNSTTDETISERSPNNFESHRSPEQLHFGLYREKRKLAASLRESKSTSVMCDDMRNSLSIAGDLLRMDAMRSIRSMSVDVYYTQSTLEETDSETSFYPDKQRRSHHRGGMSEPEFLRTSGGGTARHTPFQNHGKAASEIRDAQHRTAVVDDNINTKNIDHNHYISKSKSEVTSPKNAIAQGDDPTPRKVENASVSSSCNRSTEHTTTSSDVPQSRDEEPKGEGSAVITSDYVETSTLQVSQSGGPRTRLENPTSGNLLASPAATAALSLDIHRKNSLGSSTGSPGNYPRADQGKGTECDTVKIANGNSLSESAVSPQVDSMMAATIHQSIPSPNQILLRGKGESTHHGTDYNAHTQHHIPLPQSGTATSTIQPDKIKKGYKSNTNSRPGSREIAGVQTPTKEKEKKEGKLKRLLGGKKSKRKQVSSNSKDGANDTGPNTSWDGSNSKDTNNESHIPSKEEHTLSASQEEAGSERSVSPNPHGRTLPRQTPDGVAVEDMGVGDRWAMLKGSTWSSPVDNPAAESSQFVASFSSSKANKEPANVRRRDRIDEDSACCDEPTHNRDQSAGNSLHTTAREQSADCINSESQSRWC